MCWVHLVIDDLNTVSVAVIEFEIMFFTNLRENYTFYYLLFCHISASFDDADCTNCSTILKIRFLPLFFRKVL